MNRFRGTSCSIINTSPFGFTTRFISKSALVLTWFFNSYNAWEQQTTSKQSSTKDNLAASPLIKRV